MHTLCIWHLGSISLVSHLVSHFVDLDKVRGKVGSIRSRDGTV